MNEAADTLPPPLGDPPQRPLPPPSREVREDGNWWGRFKAFLADLRDPFDVEI